MGKDNHELFLNVWIGIINYDLIGPYILPYNSIAVSYQIIFREQIFGLLEESEDKKQHVVSARCQSGILPQHFVEIVGQITFLDGGLIEGGYFVVGKEPRTDTIDLFICDDIIILYSKYRKTSDNK